MSVISMRDFSSFCCTRTAKMLTLLVSMSSAISRGRLVSGRSASSSSTNDLNGEPTLANSFTMLAAISRLATSVMTVTFSLGCTRRQVFTAL